MECMSATVTVDHSMLCDEIKTFHQAGPPGKHIQTSVASHQSSSFIEVWCLVGLCFGPQIALHVMQIGLKAGGQCNAVDCSA
jgi:hypothetical protein